MNTTIIPVGNIEQRIYFLRGRRVMLDQDLARLYGVKLKALNQAVKRNRGRFPKDFMFQLNQKEASASRSQIVTLKRGENIKYLPYAFTEQGVAMLSSVLRSERAIQVNISIMRTFAKLREIISSNKDLARRLDELEGKYDAQFKAVFNAIRELMEPPKEPPRKIGFAPPGQK